MRLNKKSKEKSNTYSKIRYKKQIYQGNLFREWMQTHHVTHEDLWGDYPLGNIVNRDQSQMNRIFKYQSNANFGKATLTFIDS